jgi:hypothetical protein
MACLTVKSRDEAVALGGKETERRATRDVWSLRVVVFKSWILRDRPTFSDVAGFGLARGRANHPDARMQMPGRGTLRIGPDLSSSQKGEAAVYWTATCLYFIYRFFYFATALLYLSFFDRAISRQKGNRQKWLCISREPISEYGTSAKMGQAAAKLPRGGFGCLGREHDDDLNLPQSNRPQQHRSSLTTRGCEPDTPWKILYRRRSSPLSSEW